MTERCYLILIETTDAGCSARVPDLPGCVTAAADRQETEHEGA
jgi:predicted RNase H-like HicB family nuclease